MRHNLFSWLVSASTLAHAFEYWSVLNYTRNEHVGMKSNHMNSRPPVPNFVFAR